MWVVTAASSQRVRLTVHCAASLRQLGQWHVNRPAGSRGAATYLELQATRRAVAICHFGGPNCTAVYQRQGLHALGAELCIVGGRLSDVHLSVDSRFVIGLVPSDLVNLTVQLQDAHTGKVLAVLRQDHTINSAAWNSRDPSQLQIKSYFSTNMGQPYQDDAVLFTSVQW